MPELSRLREIRESQALSQRDLSERSGVAQASIARLEHGRPARHVTTRKLAAALGVEPSALTGPLRPPAPIRAVQPEPDAPKPDQRSAIAPTTEGLRGAAFARQQAEVARLEGNESEAQRWDRIAEAAEQREDKR